jgi:hypothetical protein
MELGAVFAFTVIAVVLSLALTGLWRHRDEFFGR